MNDDSPKTLRILGSKVAIKRDTPLGKTAAGIFIPEGAQKETTTGTVIAIGDGHLCTSLKGASRPDETRCHREPLQVQVGDRVAFGKWSGNEIPVDEAGKDKITVLEESDILAILPD